MRGNRGRVVAGLRLGVLLLAAVLSACGGPQRALLDHGIEAARQAKTAEAEALKASVCAMGLGAYHRINSAAEKQALDLLCGGDGTRPVTADDIRTIRDLGVLFGGS